MKPACMDDGEYALWSEANRILNGARNRAKRPCSDCPMAFYLEQRAKDSCDGVPDMRQKRPVTPELMRRRVQWRAAQARKRARAAA